MKPVADTRWPRVCRDGSVAGRLRSLPSKSQSQVCQVAFENVNTIGTFIKILTLSWAYIIRMEISGEYFFPGDAACISYFYPGREQYQYKSRWSRVC